MALMAFKFTSMRPYGRPLDLQRVVNGYFEFCEKDGKAPCMSGLGLFVNASVKTLNDWAKMEEFGPILDEAFLKMENWLEERLITKEGKTEGIQYALDNRFGWRERREYELGKETREAAAAALPMKDKLELIEKAQQNMAAAQERMLLMRVPAAEPIRAQLSYAGDLRESADEGDAL